MYMYVQYISSATNEDRHREITECSERYEHYTLALQQQRLEVHPVRGDGNCLFRAVAHQVYGQERLHGVVREKCMDYMQSQAEFYSQFVVGGGQMFPLYVGEWGGEGEGGWVLSVADNDNNGWRCQQ
jgi:OTU domain-containing protein 5